MSSAEQRAKARVAYIELRKNLIKMGGTVLEMMRHPDVSAEQVMQTHLSYSKVYGSFVETTKLLREKFLLRGTLISEPWWDKLP